jgi:glycosyltransferase involved in cell wall biosynthesis
LARVRRATLNRLRVLALSPVPYEGAGCRFRIAQYLPYLRSQGIDVTIAPFYDRQFFDMVFRPRQSVRKAWSFVKRTAARLMSVAHSTRYDAIFIYREALPVGPALLEAVLRALGRPMIFDFDDAVFLQNTSEANRYLKALKRPQKTGWIIAHSDQVIAGNEYLASYARRFNPSVHVIPTPVDTTYFVPAADPRSRSRMVVGWIGTPTTAPYLARLRAPLAALAREQDFTFRVSGAGAGVCMPHVRTEMPEWSLDREVELFNTCDVGVYPIPDDDWARGKCGFKAIQFMSCGVPVVASPVGVNREIIEEGVTGFFATTDAEWQQKIGRLVADAGLRLRIGGAARRRIEERYSLAVNAPRVASVIRQAVARARVTERIPSVAGDHRP